MAFSAVILGTMVSLTALLVSTLALGTPALSAILLALAAGQTTFAFVLVKALTCKSLRRTSSALNSGHG